MPNSTILKIFTSNMNKELRILKRKGVKNVFGDELIIGSVKAQSDRLKEILLRIEMDARWKEHGAYYAEEMRSIEKNLRKIRRADLEPINKK